jgi:enhancer of polycomb-like protein
MPSSPGSDVSPPPAKRVAIIQAAPARMQRSRNIPTYRRRIGRGGRILIDRRRGQGSVSTQDRDLEPEVQDRMKFDLIDMDEDEYSAAIPVDPYSDW